MKIRTGKEIINKTAKDIPVLVQIIHTKEQELKDLLTQEKIACPLDLKGKAYETFQKTKKEILSTLHIMEKLGYKGNEGMLRKLSKTGPFITFKPVNYNTPKKKRELQEILRQQKEILKRKEVNREELNKFHITI